jgi:hypothetical protein
VYVLRITIPPNGATVAVFVPGVGDSFGVKHTLVAKRWADPSCQPPLKAASKVDDLNVWRDGAMVNCGVHVSPAWAYENVTGFGMKKIRP